MHVFCECILLLNFVSHDSVDSYLDRVCSFCSLVSGWCIWRRFVVLLSQQLASMLASRREQAGPRSPTIDRLSDVIENLLELRDAGFSLCPISGRNDAADRRAPWPAAAAADDDDEIFIDKKLASQRRRKANGAAGGQTQRSAANSGRRRRPPIDPMLMMLGIGRK